MSFRLLVLIAAAGLFAVSATDAKQIVWWRTEGAAVVEHSLTDGAPVCSLIFYNQQQAAVVTWEADNQKGLDFSDINWDFPGKQSVPIAVRVGDTWLGNPVDPGKPNLTATAGQQWVSVPVQQSIEPVLQDATQITAAMPNRGLSVDIDHAKMPQLLPAVHRCRTALADARRPYRQTPNVTERRQWR